MLGCISNFAKSNEVSDQYFSKNNSKVISRHQSAALLNGTENDEELALLANDVFNYFGQGSGNVRKVFLPKNFNIEKIFRAFEHWCGILDHSPYANNYQYWQSVYLMNQISHFDNGFLLLTENTGHRAPTGVLYYEFYDSYAEIHSSLMNNQKIANVYVSLPNMNKERAFGDSINQMLLVPDELKLLIK